MHSSTGGVWHRRAGLLQRLAPLVTLSSQGLTPDLALMPLSSRAGFGTKVSAKRVREDLIETTDDVVFAIELDGVVIGAIQYSEEPTPDYRHAGMDIFLAPRWHSQGLGSEALRVLARYLFDDRGHHRLTIDPVAANERAIRAYERVGFRPVGVMREYERGPDGTWRVGLLMNLLAGEFRPG
jgi:aminoglycoside 6'-N-acetyltransferase